MICVVVILVLVTLVRSEADSCAYEKERCEAKMAVLQSERDGKAEEIRLLTKRVAQLESRIARRRGNRDIQRGPVTETCKTSTTGGCFWTELRLIYSTTFTDAERICEEHNSVVAVIPDEETYNAVVANARPKTPPSLARYAIWTGMKVINPSTGKVRPRNAFYKWWPGYPYTGSNLTHVLIHINKDPKDKDPVNQGMYNMSPGTGREGVVCWKPRGQYISTVPTMPTTAVTPEIPRGPVTDSCKTDSRGGCFWTEVRLIYSTTFADAEKICEDHDSVVAVIPDEETYNAIVANAVPKTPSYLARYAIWTGMQVTNPSIGELEPLDAFYNWWPGNPTTNSEYTHVVIHIITDPNDRDPADRGMYNISPETGREGVVCWKPRRQ